TPLAAQALAPAADDVAVFTEARIDDFVFEVSTEGAFHLTTGRHFLCSSMYFTTSWTVRIFSASSSEISMSYSSSSAITSSTMSSESAPRSSMKDASGVTSSSLTPSCSQMISFTFCSTLAAINPSYSRARGAPSHEESAVHVQDVTGDVAGARRREERDCRGDVVGRSSPADRDHGRVERLLLL